MLNKDCLAGFEPVIICFQHRFKMPGELKGQGGFRVKNLCVGLRPAPPLAEARVTPASYRQATRLSLRCFGMFPRPETGESSCVLKGSMA